MSSDESSNVAPQWMIDLESRLKTIKQNHHQLGHEVGAGSPCTTCGDKCPGLDLHFWRKRCINCKCKKEDHDVPVEDNRLRFEILLYKDGPKHPSKTFQSIAAVLDMQVKPRPSRNAALRQYMQVPIQSKQVTFDWIPPDISNELAADYMGQLPEHKLPISGTTGAKYRKLQLEKQIPLYDISPEIIHGLTPAEQKGFCQYLQNVIENAVGQGRIQRICQKQYLENSVPYSALQEPHCSKGLLLDQLKKDGYSEDETNPVTNLNNFRNLLNFELAHPHSPTYEKPSPQTMMKNLPSQIPTSVLPFPSPFKSPKSNTFDDINEKKRNVPVELFKENAGSYSHPKNNNDEGISTDSIFVKEEGTENDVSSISGILPLKKNLELTGRPDNSTLNIADLSLLEQCEHANVIEGNANNNNDLCVIVNSDASQTHNLQSCPKPINPIETDMITLDMSNANNSANENRVLAVEKIINCFQCKNDIQFGSVAVLTDRAGNSTAWHPQCFICAVCQELLVDLLYFFHKDKVYCGRHYAEKVKIPRCVACDELIFVNEYTVADGNSYHIQHFSCCDCDVELGGKSYVLLQEQPVCLECYDKFHCKRCHTCSKPVRAGDKGIKLNDFDWHADENCFKCTNCAKSLVSNKFTISNNNPFCSKMCVETFTK